MMFGINVRILMKFRPQKISSIQVSEEGKGLSEPCHLFKGCVSEESSREVHGYCFRERDIHHFL
jgi:hypothetical protein